MRSIPPTARRSANGGRFDLLAAIDDHPELRERVEGEARGLR